MPEISGEAELILSFDREYLLEHGILTEDLLTQTGVVGHTVMDLVGQLKSAHQFLTELGIPERGFGQYRCQISQPLLPLDERLRLLADRIKQSEKDRAKIHELSKPREQ